MPLCADVGVWPLSKCTENMIDNSVPPIDLAMAMRGTWSTVANRRTRESADFINQYGSTLSSSISDHQIMEMGMPNQHYSSSIQTFATFCAVARSFIGDKKTSFEKRFQVASKRQVWPSASHLPGLLPPGGVHAKANA